MGSAVDIRHELLVLGLGALSGEGHRFLQQSVHLGFNPFKFRGIEQIYQANVPTLNNVKIKALFYGMKNSDKPAAFEVNPPITLKADAQQPTMRIQLEIDPEKVKGFKFLIIEIKGKKYFVFK